MLYENEMTLIMASCSRNEAFARVSVAAFIAQLDPNLSDLSDIKTAVSEAVTNSIIHGYEGRTDGFVTLICKYKGDEVYIEVSDEGRGIENVEEARKPLYTSKPEMERSGMGFTVMETFMDSLEIISTPGRGTKIIMTKKISLGSV